VVRGLNGLSLRNPAVVSSGPLAAGSLLLSHICSLLAQELTLHAGLLVSSLQAIKHAKLENQIPLPFNFLHSKWMKEPSAKIPKQSCRWVLFGVPASAGRDWLFFCAWVWWKCQVRCTPGWVCTWISRTSKKSNISVVRCAQAFFLHDTMYNCRCSATVVMLDGQGKPMTVKPHIQSKEVNVYIPALKSRRSVLTKPCSIR